MQSPIDPADLAVFDPDIEEERAEAMIATVWARARTVAPCLASDDVELSPDQFEVVKGIVRDAVLRWSDVGTGVTKSRTAGDYAESYDAGAGRSGLFRPDEIHELQNVCRAVRRPTQRAYSIDLGFRTPGIATAHPFLTA